MIETKLEQLYFGAYYFFPDWGFFRINNNTGGLPPDYFSPQKSTIIPPDKITSFIEEHGEILKTEPSVRMEPALLERKTVENYQQVTIDHKEVNEKGVTLGITYTFGDLQIPFREIFEARKNKKRFLIQGNTWIDAMSTEFSWMDGVDGESLGEGDMLHVNTTEYLRILAMHDQPEKRFSAGTKRWFEGLSSLEHPGRLPSISEMKGKLRPYQRNGYGWLWFLYRERFFRTIV